VPERFFQSELIRSYFRFANGGCVFPADDLFLIPTIETLCAGIPKGDPPVEFHGQNCILRFVQEHCLFTAAFFGASSFPFGTLPLHAA